ncbi:hypothetical protein FIV41_25865 [Pseudomonas marginalis]|uniref:Uncharacterized protein n=1 Tax=Pseudomonas marginalis TaxID=298 RepID=A0A9X9BMI7_PSEMA|nr:MULTISPECIES: hypothetical protein [Pseudomonas fluorescens group]TWR52517.1 hypothetical protein FIV41_25865 [Pseudomonas marginalis]SEC54466.1 hypothetical protein SAMN04490193_3007 [Pseudomonas marginalis]VVO23198.1 hypothetical protein PS720_04389 [Pseudomonas fluorescens]
MTQLQIKKADKAELVQLIEWETLAYKGRFSGNDYDYDAKPNDNGQYPRKHFHGAVEQITERSLIVAMGVLQAKLAEGYTMFLSNTLTPEVTSTGAAMLYVKKPEAPTRDDKGNYVRIEGVEYQCDEISKLTAEVTATYEASIDAHNNLVFEQEAKALKVEEDAARRALALEDAAKQQAEFEKRVQTRIRGLRAGK